MQENQFQGCGNRGNTAESTKNLQRKETKLVLLRM